MNIVQTITPPRFLALCLGTLILVFYHLGRRPALLEYATSGKALPIFVAISCLLVLGYGLAMLWWLIRQTKGQFKETFRPTRGRIIGAFSLMFVTPVVVFSEVPWILGVLTFMVVVNGNADSLWGIGLILGSTLVLYPLSAMILRHTYHRRWMRFGLFCLSFWSAYAAHLLVNGVMKFTLVL
ncbi:hypothetical protein SAMN05444287_3118 [Octadecabacter temperatus]|uniref:Uncharacterized protein n=1 Tax=Octadecabacter temperatus TaxID=1458307 RepID=A0A0K0Y8Q4_9RHOB|nr:hypothetical protein [Octadecabacter temperatus]AKS47242.1 hypothetical protein OSB_27180 [Octadecabacter temperatus]SIO44899.1 hypothetical protein SAMN05444287_3118 [Octadecabacter temperatus]